MAGEVAQSVERETENLCVGGSIPSLAIPTPPLQPPAVLYLSLRSRSETSDLQVEIL